MSELLETSSVRITDENQTNLTDATGSRRKFLIATTSVVGIAGATIASWPFLASWMPSQRAKVTGGPVRIDVSKIEPGAQVMVTWQGKPVWVLHRTPEMIEKLSHEHLLGDLADPESGIDSQQPGYAQNSLRSVRPEILVVIAICTHLGCIPLFRPGKLSTISDDKWMGGYYCPCHKSKFDLAGRVYKSVPAPTNLIIPPHQYLDKNTIVIGSDDVRKAV